MSRYSGTFKFPANFEALIKAPIDARQLVGYKSDLIDPSTWKDSDGNIWLFDGLITAVANDSSVNNGVYLLRDSDNFTSSSSWLKVGGESALQLVSIGTSGEDVFAGYDASGNAEIRKISAGNNIDVSIVNDSLEISSTASGGTSQGNIFIIDVSSQSGNIGNKIWEPNTVPSNTDLIQCTTDTDNVNIYFIAEGGENYSPIVTLDGSTNSNLQQYSNDRRLFFGYFDIDLSLNTDASVIKTVTSSTGKNDSVKIIKAGGGPQITDVSFGPYPGSQTALKEDDIIDVYITVENEATSCWIESDKASKNFELLSLGTNDSGGIGYKLASGTITISSVVSDSPIDTQAENSLGTNGNVYTSGVLTIDQDAPQITFNSITYPGGQQALKSSDSADVDVTVSDFTSIQYNDIENQINIPNTNTYSQIKTITAYVNTYNISTNNYQIIATKSTNDTSAEFNTIIQLAGIAATIDISTGVSRLRSGGNRGTSPQDHTITIISDQELSSAPSLTAEEGTWQGTGFTGGPTTWSRDLQIHDDDSKGIKSFSNLVATNLAGVNTTTINSGSNYEIGGFVFRTLPVPAYPNRDTSIGTYVTDPTKLQCTNLSTGDSGSLNWSYISSKTSTDDSYTIINGNGGPYDPNGNYWWNADDANATSNTTGLMEIELEELI